MADLAFAEKCTLLASKFARSGHRASARHDAITTGLRARTPIFPERNDTIEWAGMSVAKFLLFQRGTFLSAKSSLGKYVSCSLLLARATGFGALLTPSAKFTDVAVYWAFVSIA